MSCPRCRCVECRPPRESVSLARIAKLRELPQPVTPLDVVAITGLGKAAAAMWLNNQESLGRFRRVARGVYEVVA